MNRIRYTRRTGTGREKGKSMEKREDMEEIEGRKAMKGEKEKLKEKGNTIMPAGRQDPPRFTCMSGGSSPISVPVPEVLWWSPDGVEVGKTRDVHKEIAN